MTPSTLLQDDEELVYEFVGSEGLSCLLKVGQDSEPTFQPYILKGGWAQTDRQKRVRTHTYSYRCIYVYVCTYVCNTHTNTHTRAHVHTHKGMIGRPSICRVCSLMVAVTHMYMYIHREGIEHVCASFVCAAIGEIVVYVDGMNGLMRCPEAIQWLYSLTGSKVGMVKNTRTQCYDE